MSATVGGVERLTPSCIATALPDCDCSSRSMSLVSKLPEPNVCCIVGQNGRSIHLSRTIAICLIACVGVPLEFVEQEQSNLLGDEDNVISRIRNEISRKVVYVSQVNLYMLSMEVPKPLSEAWRNVNLSGGKLFEQPKPDYITFLFVKISKNVW